MLNRDSETCLQKDNILEYHLLLIMNDTDAWWCELKKKKKLSQELGGIYHWFKMSCIILKCKSIDVSKCSENKPTDNVN